MDMLNFVPKQAYYQWIPFILGLQCILFYMPHLIWQTLSTYCSGGDLFSLIKMAGEASVMNRSGREGAVKRVAEFLEDMINIQQECRKVIIIFNFFDNYNFIMNRVLN